jgi:hypothetical protein
MVLLIAIATFLAACGDPTLGSVDHSCPGNPARAQGSGCDDGGG